MRSDRQLRRWLMREIHGRDLPRARGKAPSLLHPQPWRCYRYRQWIKSLPSAVSDAYGCDPCHTGPHPFGIRASDATCIPLTRTEHDEFDANPEAFCAKYGLDVKALTRRLQHAWFRKIAEGL